MEGLVDMKHSGNGYRDPLASRLVQDANIGAFTRTAPCLTPLPKFDGANELMVARIAVSGSVCLRPECDKIHQRGVASASRHE